jgi:transposase
MNRELFDFWQDGMEEMGKVTIMEDGALYHKGAVGVCMKQLEKDGFMSWGPGIWPAYSPDLDPIENLWHVLCSNIHKRKVWLKNKEELIVVLKEEWVKIKTEIVNCLCLSMVHRMKAVIANEWAVTKY